MKLLSRSQCCLALYLICTLLALAGCQSVATFHVGHKVPAGESVPLDEGGPHQGTWESFEVVIPYTYEQQAGTLEILFS